MNYQISEFDVASDRVGYYDPEPNCDSRADLLSEKLGSRITDEAATAIDKLIAEEVGRVVRQTQQTTIVRALSFISTCSKPAMAVDLLWLAADVRGLLDDTTQADVARKHNVTRQHVNSELKKLSEELGIEPDAGKGEHARDVCVKREEDALERITNKLKQL